MMFFDSLWKIPIIRSISGDLECITIYPMSHGNIDFVVCKYLPNIKYLLIIN